jgi:hypothetical protein
MVTDDAHGGSENQSAGAMELWDGHRGRPCLAALTPAGQPLSVASMIGFITLAEGVPSSVHRARERERMLCGLLTCEPFRPFDRIHALSFLAVPIEAARLPQRVLRGDQLLGSRPTDTFRLLSRRGPAASLALHVLRRCGTSLRCLTHGSSWRMLLAAAAHLPRWGLGALCGLIHCGRGRCCGRPDSAAADDAAVLVSAAPIAAVEGCWPGAIPAAPVVGPDRASREVNSLVRFSISAEQGPAAAISIAKRAEHMLRQGKWLFSWRFLPGRSAISAGR